MAKKRTLDVLLVERGLAETREKAKRSIMAGVIYSENERLDKPGMKVEVDISLRIKGDTLKYVSRGGLKLEKSLDVFAFRVDNKVGLDIGASTGGFTDCALQNGAKKMYAVDVGYNQLAWKIRQDERVVVMERMNFRHATKDDFKEAEPEFASIDVSFISLRLILPALSNILADAGDVMALIKPQFEAGKDQVGKKGIVREPNIHKQVITDIVQFAGSIGFIPLQIDYSPITGEKVMLNFCFIEKGPGNSLITEENIDTVVQDSQRLKNK
ncbi:LOW QUALITY PROTEIN: RNA binding methyltransferase FtsJ like [Bacillus sp. JCM 19046]|nr:LOW QUALITY PROTEIN: RNA binding methyltransferase FtsJ like [Bacillus sp. JCM 19046]